MKANTDFLSKLRGPFEHNFLAKLEGGEFPSFGRHALELKKYYKTYDDVSIGLYSVIEDELFNPPRGVGSDERIGSTAFIRSMWVKVVIGLDAQSWSVVPSVPNDFVKLIVGLDLSPLASGKDYSSPKLLEFPGRFTNFISKDQTAKYKFLLERVFSLESNVNTIYNPVTGLQEHHSHDHHKYYEYRIPLDITPIFNESGNVVRHNFFIVAQTGNGLAKFRELTVCCEYYDLHTNLEKIEFWRQKNLKRRKK